MLIGHNNEAYGYTETIGTDFSSNVRQGALPALLQEYLQTPASGAALAQVYSERGFGVVEQPRVSVNERVEGVRAALRKYTAAVRYNSPWQN